MIVAQHEGRADAVTPKGFARAAVGLATRGLAVFPLRPGSKIPLPGSHGHRDASSVPELASSRWTERPHANVGIATGPVSGIWVLDVDSTHGGDQSLAALEAEFGPLPATIAVATPSSGRHLYWRWPADGAEIRNSASRIAAGLDVRGAGGYVVAPPSALDGGGRYRWVDTGAGGFFAAPAWLVERARSNPPASAPRSTSVVHIAGELTRYAAAGIADELARLSQAPVGGRNDQLNRSAFALGQFVATGCICQDWAWAELERLALGTGLSRREARSTIASGLRAGIARPRSLVR